MMRQQDDQFRWQCKHCGEDFGHRIDGLGELFRHMMDVHEIQVFKGIPVPAHR